MLPDFPESRPIELADKEIIEPILADVQPNISELTFANLYLWRNAYQFRLSKIQEGLVISAVDVTSNPFFLPPVGVSDPLGVISRMLPVNNRVCRVPEELALELEAAGFQIELDSDNSDYIYLASDLIELAGRKFHRKRNQITQFQSHYSCEYRRVTPELIPGCLDLQQKWCDVRDCFVPENRSLADENAAVEETLSLLDELNLVAGAVSIDGKVAAFSVGGKLNDETLVIHFEKANPAYPGLYQVINQEFCSDAAANYKFVNREQDLGEPGLRKAKESYFPDHMVYKYSICSWGSETL